MSVEKTNGHKRLMVAGFSCSIFWNRKWNKDEKGPRQDVSISKRKQYKKLIQEPSLPTEAIRDAHLGTGVCREQK